MRVSTSVRVSTSARAKGEGEGKGEVEDKGEGEGKGASPMRWLRCCGVPMVSFHAEHFSLAGLGLSGWPL